MSAAEDRSGFLDRLKGALAAGNRQGRPERRKSSRLKMAIPVELKIGGRGFEPRRLCDVGFEGLRVEGADPVQPGERAAVRFEGYPGVCEPFVVTGVIIRASDDPSQGMAIRLDRKQTPPEVSQQYRELVRHYLHHRPLLDDPTVSGLVEGRCQECDWLGRVSERKPDCPLCGGRVKPI